MKIYLDDDYYIGVGYNLLGYVGEHESRTVEFINYSVDGANAYRLRLCYSDGITYDVDINDGSCVIQSSLLRRHGTVKGQILALNIDGENCTFVKKSNVFDLVIGESLGDETEPIPTPEIAVDALAKIQQSENNAKLSEENAKESETQAKASETNAKTSETNAKASETNAKESENVIVAKSQEIAQIAESIPADYTSLSDSVDELKGDLNNKTKELWNFNDNNFDRLNMIPKELTDGEYYRYTDGAKVSSATACRSDFIRIKPETNYTISVPVQVCFYSNDYSFLSGVNTTWNSKIITTPETCEYVIVSFDIKFKDSIQLRTEDGDSEYYSRGTVKVKENVVIPVKNVQGALSLNDESINQKDVWSSFKVHQEAKKVLNTIAYQKNLLKTDGWTNGFYKHYNSGLAVESERYSYSDYIEILDNTEYVSDANAHICFYDSDKEYIGGAVINQSTGQTQPNFVTPNGSMYLVISILTNKIGNSVLVEGSTKPQKYESAGKWALRDCVETLVSDTTKSHVLVVDQSGAGDYNNVTDAVSAAQDGAIIFVKNGVYENEKIEAFQKKIHLVGESKIGCVILNNTGNYATPPIEIGAGHLENLTFYAKKDSNTPSDTDGRSYAMHVESNTLYNNILEVRNCGFVSDFYPSVGMGMRGGCTVMFDNCDFSLNETGGGTSAFYAHDADNDSYVGVSDLIIRNSRVINYRTQERYAIKLQSQEKIGAIVNLKMQNVKTQTYGTGNLPLETKNYYGGSSENTEDFEGLINWRLNKESYGNTASVFNYDVVN